VEQIRLPHYGIGGKPTLHVVLCIFCLVQYVVGVVLSSTAVSGFPNFHKGNPPITFLCYPANKQIDRQTNDGENITIANL